MIRQQARRRARVAAKVDMRRQRKERLAAELADIRRARVRSEKRRVSLIATADFVLISRKSMGLPSKIISRKAAVERQARDRGDGARHAWQRKAAASRALQALFG